MLNEQIKKFKNVLVSDHKNLVNITSVLKRDTKKCDYLKNIFGEFIQENEKAYTLENAKIEDTIMLF